MAPSKRPSLGRAKGLFSVPSPAAKLVPPSAEEIAAAARASRRSPVAPSKRTTERASQRGLFRPTWHRVVGFVVLVTGIALFAVNDLALFDVGLMPGGHNEIWAPTAIVLVVSSLWWFGWLDRPQGRR